MPTIETLTVDVKANTSKLSSGMKSAGIAVAALGVAAISTFNAFEDAEAVSRQTDAVIKSTGASANVTAGQVEQLAASLSAKSGVDDEAIQSGENMLLTFKNIRNEVGQGNDIFNQATTAALDMAAGMAAASGGAVDLKGANIQLGKALNDPVAGISALTRVGVTFTAQQEKQIAKMQESGDMLGAQKVILAEVESQFKGSAAANKTSALTTATAFGDLQEAVGGVVAAIAGPLLGVLQPVLDLMTRYPGVTAAVAAGIVAIVVAYKLWQAWTLLTAAAQKVLLASMPWALIAIAVIALVVIIVKNWDKIKAVIMAVWKAIKAAGIAVWNAIKAAVIAYFNFYKAIFKIILAVAKAIWNGIKAAGIAIWKVISGAFKAAWNGIKAVWNTMKSAFISGWHAIRDVGVGIWDAVKGAAITVLNAIIGFLNTAIDGMNVLIHGFNRIPGVPDIPDIPMIPTLKKGGTVLKTGLAVVHEGERYSGVGRGSWGGGVTVNVYGSVMTERDLADTIHKALLRSKGRSGALGLA